MIVFFDIDGTLMDGNGFIPPSTIEGIHRIQKAGHYACLCTGRTLCMIPENILDLGFDGIVCAGGAQGIFHGDTLFRHMLSMEQITLIQKVLDEYGVYFSFEGEEHVYVQEAAFTDVRPNFGIFIQTLGNVVQLYQCPEQTNANKITACFSPKNYEKLDEIEAKLSHEYFLVVHERPKESETTALTDGLVEFLPKGINKASGIQQLIDKLGIKWDETVAFGDSNNDLEMLSYVKTAVAMGNATQKAMEVSNYVTKDLLNDGIYHGLCQIGLLKEE